MRGLRWCPLVLAHISLLLASSQAAPVRKCGTQDLPAELLQKVQNQLDATMQSLLGTTDQQVAGQRLASMAASNDRTAGTEAAGPASGINVGVYVHIISKGMTPEQGNIPDSMVAAQIQALNNGYNATGVVFLLAGTTRTVNSTWFTAQQNSQEENEMTTVLYQGDARNLNLYVLNTYDPVNQILGWAPFPFTYIDEPTRDGVFIDFNSMPGGNIDGFNLGNTAVHETGHWLGLYHPFQGGCSNPGDYVRDTPEQAYPQQFCVSQSEDTCPESPGIDVFRNYMDYPPDACMDSFTTGQATRIKVSWDTYRSNGKGSNANEAPYAPDPTYTPTHAPTLKPTVAPTRAPTNAPTRAPTSAPTRKPTAAPTRAPTRAPTQQPTPAPPRKSLRQPDTRKPTRPHPTHHKKPHPTKKPKAAKSTPQYRHRREYWKKWLEKMRKVWRAHREARAAKLRQQQHS